MTLLRRTAACLAALCMFFSAALAEQMTPPGMPEGSVSLWMRDGQGYLQPMEDGADLSSIPWGQYVTPRLALANTSDEPMSFSCLWRLDGEEIPFADVSLQPGDAVSLCLSRDTASVLGPGEHSLAVILSGSVLCDMTFTLTDSGMQRPDPPLTFCGEGVTAANIRVSGLNWRYRRQAASKTSPSTAAVAQATLVKEVLAAGGSFTFHYKITCTGARSPITVPGSILIVAPNGFCWSVEGEVVLCEEYRRYDEVGGGFFPALLEQCGDIPAGDYRLILILQGMPANVSILTLK